MTKRLIISDDLSEFGIEKQHRHTIKHPSSITEKSRDSLTNKPLFVTELARFSGKELEFLMGHDNIIAITKRPKFILGRTPHHDQWTVELRASVDSVRYQILRMEKDLNIPFSDLWQLCCCCEELGHWSTKYLGWFGGYTKEHLSKAISATHRTRTAADTTLLSRYYKNPVQFSDQKLDDWKRALKIRSRYTGIKDSIRGWAMHRRLPHATIYCSLFSETCKTRDPRKRPPSHYGEICYGVRNLDTKTVPVMVTFPIPSDCKPIICWHTMTGAIYYADRET